MQCALTIAGSDSSGGAGIQADLKTFAALGVYGTCAITAITAQNTRGVITVSPLAPELVAAQIDAVAADFRIGATKIGMLAAAGVVEAVADALVRHRLTPMVLDPVLISTSGARLLDEDGVALLRARLLPLAAAVTPNAPEVEALTGLPVHSVADARRAALRLVELGARAVVVTGGHFEEGPVDLVLDEGTFTEISGERLPSRHTHGTGCTFSSAVAARLALGDGLVAAVRAAKAFVADAIRRAPGLGGGIGPLGH
jgi:hydroxymethylpyrimidine/phosphomethylpyrimidine kinase